VRVEDDRAVVTGNAFVSDDVIDEAIVVGTHYRTTALSQPVDGTVVTGNTATIAGSANPYRWIWGHTNTTFSDNRSLGRVVGLCEGVQPPVGPFVMTVAVQLLEDPENPPMEIRELPLPDLLPPCENGCDAGAIVSKARLTIRNLDTPPGDDVLSVKGEIVLPHPFDPPLDPVALGVGVVIQDAAGVRALDVTVPGGPYDPVARAGWQVSRSGTRWKYVNKNAMPPAGVARLSIREMPKEPAGSLQVKVTGRRGAYPVDTAQLPLAALLVLDPPTAGTGQCGVATFVGPEQGCTADGKRVRCQ
jgi:hypothetical protein